MHYDVPPLQRYSKGRPNVGSPRPGREYRHIGNEIKITQRWISSFVIDLNLCPFARREVLGASVRFSVFEGQDLARALHVVHDEAALLDSDDTIETSFLILPEATHDFRDFHGFVDVAESLLNRRGWEGVYQLVGFHPSYQFAGTALEDAENFTNRSPYPMLHILRESSVSFAVDTTPDAAHISERNIATLNLQGAESLKKRWQMCFFDERSKP